MVKRCDSALTDLIRPLRGHLTLTLGFAPKGEGFWITARTFPLPSPLGKVAERSEVG